MDAPSSRAPRIPPSRVPSTPGTSAPDLSLLFHFGVCVSADVPGASERAAHVRTVQVFTQVHQRQESAQNSRLQVVRQVQAARRYARQALPVFRDELHDFTLALLRGMAQRRLPPHLRAAGFQRKREVQHAQALLGECRWRVVLTSRNLARRSHVPMAPKDLGTSPARKIQCASLRWCESYMTCFPCVSRSWTAASLAGKKFAKSIDRSMQPRV